jgi:hypothetical protein
MIPECRILRPGTEVCSWADLSPEKDDEYSERERKKERAKTVPSCY